MKNHQGRKSREVFGRSVLGGIGEFILKVSAEESWSVEKGMGGCGCESGLIRSIEDDQIDSRGIVLFEMGKPR